jgi:hypothetical protein
MSGSATATRSARTKAVAAASGVVALAVALLSVAVPAAHAATYTYANNVATPEAQPRDSGQRTSITGGNASVRLAFGTITIRTYDPAPGATTIAQVTTEASGTARVSHPRQSNARSQCYWNWQSVGGSANLTCAAIS